MRAAATGLAVLSLLATTAATQSDAQWAAAGDALVAALNAKDVALLRPALAANCTGAGLEPAAWATSLADVVHGWVYELKGHRLDRGSDGNGTIVLLLQNGSEIPVPARLDGEGRFARMELFQAKGSAPITFSGPSSTTLPMQRLRGMWAVRARADATEGQWLLDSGSKVLTPNRLFPVPEGQPLSVTVQMSGTIGEHAECWACTLPRFAIGDQVAVDATAWAMDLRHLAADEAPADGAPTTAAPANTQFGGLIGAREMACFEVRFDQPAATLTLVRIDADGAPLVARPSGYTERHPFELSDGWAILPVVIGGATFRFVFDTGSNPSAFGEHLLEVQGLTVGELRETTVRGAGSKPVPCRSGTAAGLRLHDRDLEPLSVNFLPVSRRHYDGILGLDWLRGRPFLLNFARRELVLGPEPTPSGR